MVYVHIPYCRSFCVYCGFYSELGCPGKEFVDAVCAEAAARRGEIAASSAVNTLYFGGGTPSVLPPGYIGRIADACGGRSWDEWTVEVNPDDVSAAYAAGLRALGVNRVSMGVQSLDDGILRWMARRHDASGARSAFAALRSAGFDNISVDIIYGVNGMSLQTLESTVREILSWRPEHISAYQLSVDDGSTLGRLSREGRYNELGDDDCLAQYRFVCSALAASGYEHYEISNWAIPGRMAVHNSAYWKRAPYIGLGPGAHSLYNNYRSWNSEEQSGWTAKGEHLSEKEIWEEEIMLGLRTAEGIPAELLTGYAPGEFIPDRQRYIDLLVPSAKKGCLRIPETAWFTADDIIAGII